MVRWVVGGWYSGLYGGWYGQNQAQARNAGWYGGWYGGWWVGGTVDCTVKIKPKPGMPESSETLSDSRLSIPPAIEPSAPTTVGLKT